MIKPSWHRLDIDAPPPARFPKAAREVRAQLHDFIDPGNAAVVWDQRIHEQGQQLVPLLRQVGYTIALVDGAFRCYVEYRACDRLPHYRVMWGELLWGRVDIRYDTDLHGADIQACSILKDIQDRLADYLIALGYRIESARLRPHDVDAEDEYEGDVLLAPNVKAPREHRLFRFDTNPTRPKRKAKIMSTLSEQVKSARRDAQHLDEYVSELCGLIGLDHPARPRLDEAINHANQARRYSEVASQAFEQVDQQAVIAACTAGQQVYRQGMRAADEATAQVLKANEVQHGEGS